MHNIVRRSDLSHRSCNRTILVLIATSLDNFSALAKGKDSLFSLRTELP